MKRKSVPFRSSAKSPSVGHLDADRARNTTQLPASIVVGTRYRRPFLRLAPSRLTRCASTFQKPYHTSPAAKPIRASRQMEMEEAPNRDRNGTTISCCAASLTTEITTATVQKDTIRPTVTVRSGGGLRGLATVPWPAPLRTAQDLQAKARESNLARFRSGRVTSVIQPRRSSGIRIAAILIGVIAVLYLARDILIPLAFAITLTLVLAPAVGWLQKLHIRRFPAVLVVMLVSIAVAGGISYVIFNQLVQVVNDLPSYRENIDNKIKTLRAPNKGALGRAAQSVQELGKELATAQEPPAPPAAQGAPDGSTRLQHSDQHPCQSASGSSGRSARERPGLCTRLDAAIPGAAGDTRNCSGIHNLSAGRRSRPAQSAFPSGRIESAQRDDAGPG